MTANHITVKRRMLMLTGIVGILSIPFIAMRFSDQVQWNLTDFIVAGILLGGAALAIEVILSTPKFSKLRYFFIGAVLVLLVLTIMELAVGIFGTPLAGS